MVDFLKKETIIKLINEGIEDEKNGIDAQRKIIDIIDNRYRGWYWAPIAYTRGRDLGRERWAKDFELVEKEWERFSLPRIDNRYNEYITSYNYRDDYAEAGISVIDENYKKTIGYIYFSSTEKLYKIKGIQVGFGSDNEPVIIPTSEAKEKMNEK